MTMDERAFVEALEGSDGAATAGTDFGDDIGVDDRDWEMGESCFAVIAI